jgi:DNA-binding SARP family transcriptional activator
VLARLSITLLGGFEVMVNGQPLQGFDSDKSRALLAFLAMERDQIQRRDKLAGLMWPESTDLRARRSLSQAVYNLRHLLDVPTGSTQSEEPQPTFLVNQQTVQFNPAADCRLDAAIFQSGLSGCNQHNPSLSPSCDGCMQQLDSAASVYRGDFLAGLFLSGCLEFEEWCVVIRERLRRDALTASVTLSTWHRRRGRPGNALSHARRSVELDPLWEPAQRQLMYCLWLAGDRSEALLQYEACREILSGQLGVEPDEKTRKLARRIQADVEVVSPQPAGRRNLPHALTPFIGRESELRQIQSRLDSLSCRLLTLLGPGGSGKTRLALETARRLTHDFPDGVYLVSLSGLGSAVAIVPAVAEVLGLPIQEDRDPEE